ncbi:hypothetical protein M231_02654 [Tremella mesenterica]|uniref:Barwin domain-containing protein n=1 Tax=Tremella mesenterica TaxID=5217 RepID=A0A4Q1BQ11_TREME|nr:uncharacterized protein TREMEDRAFT_64244 [Tremella mesenterica DSM 1558]EIW67650.1 hypothetical protein TREMEDRAFT_64244 [Tremella mesenterica DSM 1558]RXK40014.1 hypothetical protein M231_02654 [Tremella mesenterica]
MFKTLLTFLFLITTTYANPIHNGQGTLYIPGPGACGLTNNVNEFVVSIYPAAFIDNNGKLCGTQVTIKNPQNGATAIATIVDECLKCSTNDLDLSPAVFFALQKGNTQVGSGRVPISWMRL